TAEVPGLPLERRMTLVRLGDGSVVVHSAICLDAEAQREIDAWGVVRYVIVPNGWHRLDAAAYAERYPDARIVCPDPAKKRVEKKVRVDGNLSLIPSDPALTFAPLAGTSNDEHVLTVRSGERASLVFCDTVFNLPKLPGFHGWFYGLIGSTGAPKVTPLLHLVAVRDGRALGRHLETLATTPGLVRVVPGHGGVVEGAHEAPALMRTVAATA
ncbi:MAG TPA: hypothetical protein VMI54_09420, partial [Polyangiaceae bacterium]|nr:hypothetical protein [Polyangiaceae bacterium]